MPLITVIFDIFIHLPPCSPVTSENKVVGCIAISGVIVRRLSVIVRRLSVIVRRLSV
jgi:hypothetical protein